MPAGRPANPIKKLVSEIKATEKLLENSLEHSDIRTLAAVQTRQREWTNKLQELKQQYKAELRSRGFAIFLLGDVNDQKAFGQIASNFDCYVMNADIMYEGLAKRLWPSVRPSDQFSANHIQMIDDELHDIRIQLGIASMPHPSISIDMVRPINTLDNFVTLVKSSIERVLDSELASLYIEDLATSHAIADGYTGTVLPVVLAGAQHQQIKDFQRRLFKAEDGSVKTFVIAVGKDATSSIAEHVVHDVSNETVIEALMAAAKKFGFKISKPRNMPTEDDKTDKDQVQSNDKTLTTE